VSAAHAAGRQAKARDVDDAGTGGLAFTGSDLGGVALVGLGLVAGGIGLIRRRRGATMR
jgi:hypothetical protein